MWASSMRAFFGIAWRNDLCQPLSAAFATSLCIAPACGTLNHQLIDTPGDGLEVSLIPVDVLGGLQAQQGQKGGHREDLLRCESAMQILQEREGLTIAGGQGLDGDVSPGE